MMNEDSGRFIGLAILRTIVPRSCVSGGEVEVLDIR